MIEKVFDMYGNMQSKEEEEKIDKMLESFNNDEFSAFIST